MTAHCSECISVRLDGFACGNTGKDFRLELAESWAFESVSRSFTREERRARRPD